MSTILARMENCGIGVSDLRKLRFHHANVKLGVSYGTTLGATALAMFPDRIDRAILDGVQNTHEYYHSLYAVSHLDRISNDRLVAGILKCTPTPIKHGRSSFPLV